MRVVVTGGAGFIGSALIWGLNRRGIDEILVVDRLDTSAKWRNLVPLRFGDYLDADRFLTELEAGRLPRPELILHMGGISSTTARDLAALYEDNVAYTVRLARWSAAHGVRCLYASSAAVYGDGSRGFDDDVTPMHLARLRPLNPYGFSKLWADRILAREGLFARGIVGLRFFNVFGPNEYHKGPQRSVVPVFVEQILAEGTARLFKSVDPAIPDGHQRRDFVWIGDVVRWTLALADRPAAQGIFNLGSGEARTFLELTEAIFAALDRPVRITWIETPAELRSTYQNYTRAELGRLRAVGIDPTPTPLVQAVRTYVRMILAGEAVLDPEQPLDPADSAES